ncbi:DUF6270 domain-containing protein [Janibacter sp. UYMM211]|uniref:DUF6270 domain-containing protein n=1 Tax=Janibacter sp. UYMM211 TaxID=3156342 RepID=UPI0033943D7F
MSDDVDYSAHGEVRRWSDLASFAGQGLAEPGVDVIRLPSGGAVEVKVSGAGGPIDTRLPIFFTGAVSDRRGKRPPFFSGVQMGRLVGGQFISIADPLVSTHHEVNLGWYVGRAGDDVQETLAGVLEHLHITTGRELLLVGGSGGGFAALDQVRRARVPISALVWNPQTDILRYLPSAVDTFLDAALGEFADGPVPRDGAARQRLATLGGLDLHVLSRPNRPDIARADTLVLQNATDWHVQAHLGPYLDAGGFVDTGHGLWTSGTGACLIADFAKGHAVPPRQVLEDALLAMVKVGSDARDVAVELRNTGMAPSPPSGTLPSDLRGRVVAPLRSAGPRLTVDECGVRRLWFNEPARLPPGSVAEFGPSGRTLPGSLPSSGSAWHADDGAPTRVALRDGLGHVMEEMELPACPSFEEPALLLVGSCVSRDLIGFMSPPVSLVGYHARQSLISAFAPGRPAPAEVDQLASSFQRRMLAADFRSDLPERVRVSASSVDAVVWDVVDERLGVFVHPDGSVTTDTVEWRRLHPDGRPPAGARRVAFGTAEHKALYRDALQLWRALLVETGLLRRTILLAPRWAARTTSGQVVPPSFGVEAEEGSRVQSDYVDMIREIVGVAMVGTDVETVAGDDHRWGAAPFHFDDQTERVLARSVLDHVRDRSAPGGVTRTSDGVVLSVGPHGTGGIVAASIAPRGAKVAFHLVHDGARVDATTYGPARSHTFWGCPDGRCVVRMFVLRPDGTRESVVSVSVWVGGSR